MKKAILITAAAIMMGAAARAQEAAPVTPVTPGADVPLITTNQITRFNKASTFLGTAVQNAQGKEIGKVRDIVFDATKGQIGYAVLELTEANGRAVAVPITALKAQENGLLLNMSEPVLAASEGLTEGNWPAMDAFAVGGPAQSQSGTASSDDKKTESQPAKPEQSEPKK